MSGFDSKSWNATTSTPAAVKKLRRAPDVARRDEPAVGDEQRAPEAQLARQLAEARDRALAEDDARARLKVERLHEGHGLLWNS